jgi:hypothetical protein
MASQAGVPLSARGGYAVVAYGATPTDPNAASDTTFFVVDNGEYSNDNMAIEDDVTTSFNTAGTRKFGGLLDPKITITLPEDDISSVESVTLSKGSYYTVWLRRGNASTASHMWDKTVGACFMGLRKQNPTATGGKRTVVLEFAGGDYTGYTGPSSALTSYLGGLTPARS